MRAKLVRLFRDESIAITVPAGFMVLYAIWSFLGSIVTGLVYPLVLRALGRDPNRDPDDYYLRFHIGNVLIDVTWVVTVGATLVLLSLLIYVLMTRWLVDDDALPETRECPECKSDIFVDARRCAFCSVPVTPLIDVAVMAEEPDAG